jgi:hypothetical protein
MPFTASLFIKQQPLTIPTFEHKKTHTSQTHLQTSPVMKTMKNIALIGIASMLLSASAQAQVNIYISGAVAFRGQTYDIIRSLFDSGFSQNPTSGANATLIAWSGTASNALGTGSQIVNIYANYNGAVAGIQNLTVPTAAQFYISATPGVTATAAHLVDFAFSSVYQATTPYTSPVLDDPQNLGVTPILWIKSTNSLPGITNITSQQIKELASVGALPGYFFTGNANDTSLVRLVTRDVTAGQRLIVFRDAGFTGASPAAYYNNGTQWLFDNGGRTSTSLIVAQLNTYSNAISYLTGVDAISVLNKGPNGAAVLSYNGFFPFLNTNSLSSISNDYTPVINGQYSLWGYEHLLKSSTLSGTPLTLYNVILNALAINVSSQYTIAPISSVNVGRDSDGGTVYPLY